jgi:hypothetical protein
MGDNYQRGVRGYIDTLTKHSYFIEMDKKEQEEMLQRMDSLFLSFRIPRMVSRTLYEDQDPLHIAAWANKRGFYSLPTIELGEFIREWIGGRSAHEIGAGHSAMARYLGIYHSDPRYQDKKGWANSAAQAANLPTAYVPAYVANKNADQVLCSYKPKVILAQWVTPKGTTSHTNFYGPDYPALMEQVETLIFVGNQSVHPYIREALGTPAIEMKGTHIVSRAMKPEENVVWVWGKV